MAIDILSLLKNYIHDITEFIALVISIYHYKYLRVTFMEWMLPFLLFIFLGELINKYFFLNNLQHQGIILSYIIGLVESLFYSFIFYKLTDSNLLKKIILLSATLIVLTDIVGVVFFQQNLTYYINSLIFSGLSLSFIALTYVYIKFTTDNYAIALNEPGFWIAFGISLFFSGTSIVFCLHGFIVKYNLNLFGVRLYSIVPRILCVILYLSISIAIILCKKKTKISSQPY